MLCCFNGYPGRDHVFAALMNSTRCWRAKDLRGSLWEGTCASLQVILMMELHFSFMIMVLLHALKPMGIIKLRVFPPLHLWNKIAEGFLCTDWPDKINSAILSHICYWLQKKKKECHPSSSHNCVEGPKFFVKVCHQSIVSPHSYLTGEPDGIEHFRFSQNVQHFQN